MKLYTNNEQTAKLIEIGLEKPKSIESITAYKESGQRGYTDIDVRQSYSIGELLSFLPLSFNNDDYYALTIRGSKVMYCDSYLDWIEIEWGKHEELIDNLFDACIELKEEEVI